MEKFRAVQGQIRYLLSGDYELTNKKEINNHLHMFYKSLFIENKKLSETQITYFLDEISDFPKLTSKQSNDCEAPLSEKELSDALKGMPDNKSPGNDNLTKEFYETFWSDIKILFFFENVLFSFDIGELSISQRQSIIKLIEKKYRDKRLIENWRPISLLNVDAKIISKLLAKRLKNVLSPLISDNQTAYINGRFISEGGRLISDILEISAMLSLKGLLLTVDIQKAFDSVNQQFLILVLKKFGFGNTFIKWIQTLLKNQESCVINGGNTTKYFKLERGPRQGDPISAYLFILVLELVFMLMKQNKNIKGLNLFEHTFLYTAYADDTVFFLKDMKSVRGNDYFR